MRKLFTYVLRVLGMCPDCVRLEWSSLNGPTGVYTCKCGRVLYKEFIGADRIPGEADKSGKDRDDSCIRTLNTRGCEYVSVLAVGSEKVSGTEYTGVREAILAARRKIVIRTKRLFWEKRLGFIRKDQQ